MPHQTIIGSIFFLLISLTPLFGQLEDWDSDHDAMPNGWEYYRNLDLNDQRDAWDDSDGDGIFNLFEYFLGNPHDNPYQPVYIPYDQTIPLAEFIRKAPRGAVLQIPEGHYPLNYLYNVEDRVPRVMIQGGWNKDFTEQDPCKYPTIFDGQNQAAVFDFFLVAENSAVLILDGLTIKNGAEGAIKFSSYRTKIQLAIINSKIVNNRAKRFDAVIHYEDGPFTIISDFLLVNSVVAGNNGSGIKVVQHANHTNLKILHSLITANQFSENDAGAEVSGYGLHYQPRGDSALHIQIANSVLWGNENSDVFQDNPDLKPIDPDSQHNIYGKIELVPDTLPLNSVLDRFTDPQPLMVNNDYRFASEGPTRNAGIDIGIFSTTTPNVGPAFCPEVAVNTGILPFEKDDFHLFPNPTTGTFQVNSKVLFSKSLHLIVFNSLGQVLWTEDWPSKKGKQFEIPGHLFPKGQYRISIVGSGKYWNGKFIKL